MSLKWSARALSELEQVGEYIAKDDPTAAEKWVERLHARATKAAIVPGTGRVVPEYKREDIREVLLGNYRIVYRVHPSRILVLAVREGHQLLPQLQDLVND
jgi:plasmid stabilization system protein ParE